ncbi:hypothetical protein KIW84_046251 [Lathyrus oleraceus]|uniref:Pectinesterase inhibitor domain-containing protein n=1 Tax=Pisum sativum TaxID=3888 RepID=A0A9D5ASX7_PEA|nr:hypothetical protein KIW84_046251 [Pisum sativum]
MTFRDEFESLCGSILHRNPLHNVDSVVNELLAEEIRLKTHYNVIQNKGILYTPPSVFAASIHKGKYQGIKVAYSPKGYLLSQSKYISNILEQARISDTREANSPLQLNVKYAPSNGVTLPNPTLYRTLVGSLMYLTITIPGTQFQSLLFPSLELRAYSDADWTGDFVDHNSTTCFCIFLRDSVIPCKSKKHDIVSRSSTKVEYHAITSTTTEMVWLRWSQCAQNLEELGLVAIKLTRHNVTNTSDYITRLLKKKTSDPFIKECLEDCLEVYSDAIATFREAIRDYKAKRYEDCNFKLSSIIDASTTCEDGFKQKNDVISPLTKRNKNVFQLSAIALSIVNMLNMDT